MKFYSELTNAVYDSVLELKNAEKELKLKQEQEEKEKAEAKAKLIKEMEEAKAEKEAKIAERKEKSAEIEKALNELNELRAQCAEQIKAKESEIKIMIDEFVKKYKYFHYSFKSSEDMPSWSLTSGIEPFTSMFDKFFKNF